MTKEQPYRPVLEAQLSMNPLSHGIPPRGTSLREAVELQGQSSSLPEETRYIMFIILRL